jgi:hypothetical protein
MSHWWILALDSGEYCDVEVTQGLADKTFRIREAADVTGAAGIG